MWMLLQETDTRLLRIFTTRFKCIILDKTMPFITHMGSVGGTISLVLAILLTGIFLNEYQYIKAGFVSSLALLCNGILIQLLKKKVNRPRPQFVIQGLRAFNVPICPYSFPSGHTGAIVAVAIPLAYYLPLLSTYLFSLGIAVAFSRIYLGVHYTSDVLAGGIIGCIVSLFIVYLTAGII